MNDLSREAKVAYVASMKVNSAPDASYHSVVASTFADGFRNMGPIDNSFEIKRVADDPFLMDLVRNRNSTLKQR